MNFETMSFDLHNNYDFKAVDFHIASKTFSLIFESASCMEFKGKKADTLMIRFIDVDYLKFSDGFVQHVTHDLAEIGYKNPQDNDLDWLMGEKNCEALDHMIFRFANDEYIKLHSSSSKVVVTFVDQKKISKKL